VRNAFVPALVLAALGVACGDTAHRPIPSGAPRPALAPPPSVALAPPDDPTAAPGRTEAAARPPVVLTAAAVEGHPPLPTYHATVRNASDRPVRRVVATAVYRDAEGLHLAGENQDVAFGSPLKAIDPGVTLETTFLSRVERAPDVRLVLRAVTFLEEGTGPDPVERDWTNPSYEAELAEAEGRR